MALRELLAQFEVRVEGADQVGATDAAMSDAAEAARKLDGHLITVTHSYAKTAETADDAAKGVDTGAKAADVGARSWGRLSEEIYYATKVGLESAKWLTGIVLSIKNSSLLIDAAGVAISSFLGIGIYKITGHMWGLVDATTAEVAEISKLAAVTGAGAEATQHWMHTWGAVGATIEDVRGSFKTLGSQINAAQDQASGTAAMFKELGVDTDPTRDLNDVLLDTTVALANVTDQGKQLAYTQTLLGEGALKAISTFRGSREEMEKLLSASSELAGVYDDEFVKAAAATQVELDTMRHGFGTLRATVVSAFLPSFRWAVAAITRITSSVRSFLKETGFVDRWFKAGLVFSFARISLLVATYWGWIARYFGWVARFLTPLVRFIARFAAWALVLDDIITFLQGGDSYLGDIIDKLFGLGAGNKLLETMGGLWDKIVSAIQLGAEVLGWLFDDLGKISEATTANSAAWDSWGGGVGGVLRTVIGYVGELLGMLDKLTGWTDALNAIGQEIFEAGDAAANAAAIQTADWAAKDAARAANPKASAPVTNVNHTDNSRVSVVLQGPATPETVKTATAEAKRLQSNKGAQNALIRGTP